MEKGKAFPQFSLPDQNGVMRGPGDYAGKWLVVYFYPKDNTSGCTLEAKSFTDLAGQFADHDAVIVGVSPDSVKSHCGFIAKHGLGITLLSDPERALLEAAGRDRRRLTSPLAVPPRLLPMARSIRPRWLGRCSRIGARAMSATSSRSTSSSATPRPRARMPAQRGVPR